MSRVGPVRARVRINAGFGIRVGIRVTIRFLVPGYGFGTIPKANICGAHVTAQGFLSCPEPEPR